MLLRVGPLALLAAAAFGAGALLASGSSELDSAERFVEAWEAQELEAMHAELTPAAAAEYPLEDFQRLYNRAQRTATIDAIEAGAARGPISEGDGEIVPVALEIATDSFGVVSGELGVPVSEGAVAWSPEVVFPGLRPGETLERETDAPERAPILARDRTPLAEGPVDARTTNGAGGIVTGEIGAPPTERGRQMARQGFPDGTLAGTSGLELAFDGRLAGIPGGTLLAAGEGEPRELASAPPTPGEPLRTTLDADLQQVAADTLGDQFGGIAVLDARKGDVLAVSGVAFSAPQPPGSTFKIITAAAALQEGIAEPDSEYPTVTTTAVGGREIRNSNNESCGGTLVVSFARSCNTVFAPLGAELGGEQLLSYAERFGFNSPPTIYADEALAATQPPTSTIPEPIGSELDAGVSAIGQGQVLATPLQMASVAQTIANGGVRSPTSLVKDPELRAEEGEVEVVDADVAEQVKEMMVEVVSNGTGSAASLPDATVAGKTGTAELGPTAGGQPDPDDPEAGPELDVDAWFAAFAPAKKPKLAIAVMIVQADGDGGAIAAPLAQQVLAAGL